MMISAGYAIIFDFPFSIVNFSGLGPAVVNMSETEREKLYNTRRCGMG